MVIDGSILFLGPDQLAAPVELRVAGGRLVDAAGPEAWRLLDALERSGDRERMTNLAEVSIGLNPRSRPGGSALELEGIVGGAHVALGNNVAYGGSVDARAHIDCVILSATLALDGAADHPGGAAIDLGRLIDDILALARIPAPTFAEAARAAWLRERLAGAGGALHDDEAGNLIWTWGDADPALVVAAHLDTVFAAGTAARRPPRRRDPRRPRGGRQRGRRGGGGQRRRAARRPGAARPRAPSRSPWARRGSATCAARSPSARGGPRRASWRWRATA